MTSLERSTINEWNCLRYGKTNSHWESTVGHRWPVSESLLASVRPHTHLSLDFNEISFSVVFPSESFLGPVSILQSSGLWLGPSFLLCPSVWIILPSDTCRHRLRANDSSPTPNSSCKSPSCLRTSQQAFQPGSPNTAPDGHLPTPSLSILRKWHCLPKSWNNSPWLLPPSPPLPIHQLYFQNTSWILPFPPLHFTTLAKPLLSYSTGLFPFSTQ